ncbi:hypothetical protein WKI65_36250 [Streptomyces sp. MS1.AVA.3]
MRVRTREFAATTLTQQHSVPSPYVGVQGHRACESYAGTELE